MPLLLIARDSLSGIVGSFCCVYSGHPLDCLKVQMQTRTTGTQGLVGTFLKVIKNEGWTGLYKGAIPALNSALIESSVVFMANGLFKRAYCSATGAPKEYKLSFVEEALLGGASGFCSATCICPMELIKIRLQTMNPSSPCQKLSPKAVVANHAFLSTLKSIYRNNGIKGFFRGLPSLWCRDVPFYITFFSSYELYCSLTVKYYEKENKSNLSFFQIWVAGGLAGSTAWSIIFPADIIKSRQQMATGNKSLTFKEAYMSVTKNNTVRRNLYKGWLPAVLRGFPANGGLFLGVEGFLRLWDMTIGTD